MPLRDTCPPGEQGQSLRAQRAPQSASPWPGTGRALPCAPQYRRRPRRRRVRGQGLVELAVLMPVLLLVLAGAIDLGRVFYAYAAIGNSAYQAARESARGGYLFTPCLSTNGTSCDPAQMNTQICPATDSSYQTDAQAGMNYKVITIYALLRCELGGLFRDAVSDPTDCPTAQSPDPTKAFPIIASPNALTPPVGDGCVGWGYNLDQDAGGAQEVTVTVTYNFTFITPALLILNGTNNYLTLQRTVSVAILTSPNAQPYP